MSAHHKTTSDHSNHKISLGFLNQECVLMVYNYTITSEFKTMSWTSKFTSHHVNVTRQGHHHPAGHVSNISRSSASAPEKISKFFPCTSIPISKECKERAGLVQRQAALRSWPTSAHIYEPAWVLLEREQITNRSSAQHRHFTSKALCQVCQIERVFEERGHKQAQGGLPTTFLTSSFILASNLFYAFKIFTINNSAIHFPSTRDTLLPRCMYRLISQNKLCSFAPHELHDPSMPVRPLSLNKKKWRMEGKI